MSSEFINHDIKDLRGKIAQTYEWVNNYDNFNYPKLPYKEAFYSSLNDGQRGKGDGHISAEDYLRSKYIFKKFNCKNFGDYHRHYLKTDVLNLVAVCQTFIATSRENYELDSCYYYNSPSLSWDAMLRMTNEKIEKINDSDIHDFFKRAKRGGLCFVGKHYSKANHKNCPDYDFNKPEKHIKYTDMNNLYGYGMMDHLPYGRFKWVEVNKENIEFILNLIMVNADILQKVISIFLMNCMINLMILHRDQKK